MKKSCPACQGDPKCRGETTRPPELSRLPRRVCNPNVNGLLVLQRNKLKVTSTMGNLGEGCLGNPRPCKWGLSDLLMVTMDLKNRIYTQVFLFIVKNAAGSFHGRTFVQMGAFMC